MARHILPLIPPHNIYVEPFFGGGAIYFAKPKSNVEIINDINHFVVNFFQQTQTNFNALQKRVVATAFSRGLYKDALVVYNNPHLFTNVDKAWSFWILCNEGYAAKIGTWGYGTKENKRELAVASKRKQFLQELSDRLALTQIESFDAVRLIELRDREETFFYIDPPYIDSAQGHYTGYTHEHYRNLLETLSNIKGKFLLSSYPSELLDEFRAKNGWHQIEFKQPTMASKNRKEKIEVLTANYPIEMFD